MTMISSDAFLVAALVLAIGALAGGLIRLLRAARRLAGKKTRRH